MTQTEMDEQSMRVALKETIELVEQASMDVAKLMASVRQTCRLSLQHMLTIEQDSVPKFLRDPKYQPIIREHQIDANLAQRAMSPAPSPAPSEKPSLSRSNTSKTSKM